jgi:hypothetical protein
MLYGTILVILLAILTFALIGLGDVHFGVSRLLEDIEKERKALERTEKS